jgi:hypothetical protein
MGITLFVGEMMMLAVDGNPLAWDDAGKKTQMKVHQVGDQGVQFEPPMAH